MRLNKGYALLLVFAVQIFAGCGGGGGGGGVVPPPVADTAAPTVTGFTMPTTATSSTVPVTGLTASDNIGVSGYLVTENATAPSASTGGWTASPPANFTFSSFGTKTAYAWAKDAAGNISASRSATVNMQITSSVSTIISTSTAVGTVSISGISDPIICGIDLRVSYPSGTTYVNGIISGVTPVGSILNTPIIGPLTADITIFGTDGFSSGEIAKLNYSTVPPGSVSTGFGVTLLKVFNCSGIQIQ